MTEEHTSGGRDEPAKDGPHMHVFMSWARSTVAQVERSLGRSENYFDRILIGVVVLLAIAVVFLFTAS